MRTLIIIALLIAELGILRAQDDNYLEVSVTDTVHIPVINYTYGIYLTDVEADGGAEDYSIYQLKKMLSPEKLNELLAGLSLTSAPLENSNIIHINPYAKPGNPLILSVEVRDRAVLRELIEALRGYTNVSGTLTGYISTPAAETEGERRLNQKLIERAKAKAALLAKAIDRSVGDVISVSQHNNGDSGSWTVHAPLSNGYGDVIAEGKSDINDLSMTLFMRFALK